MVYRDGVSFFLFALNLPVAGAAVYLLGDRIRKLGKARGYVTPADLVGDYYGGTEVRLLAAATSALYVLPYVIMQIKAGGYLAQRLFPEAPPLEFFGSSFTMYETGVWALSFLTMAYVLVGGMRSVAWTDVIQGILLIFGMLVAGLATIAYFGGLGGYFEAVSALPAKALSAPGYSDKWNAGMLFSICAFASLGSIIQPGQWMRFYAAKDSNTLRKSALVFAVVLPVCFLFGIMLVALGGQVLFPPEITAEGIIPHPSVGAKSSEVDQIVIVMIQMVPGFYIGSRSLNILLKDGDTATGKVIVNQSGEVTEIQLMSTGTQYVSRPEVRINSPKVDGQLIGKGAKATATTEDGQVTTLTLVSPGSGYDFDTPPVVEIVGRDEEHVGLGSRPT